MTSCLYSVLFFFFKQKTAYEMRISDWSSDVCSSDLCAWLHRDRFADAVRVPHRDGACHESRVRTRGCARGHRHRARGVRVLTMDNGHYDRQAIGELIADLNRLGVVLPADGDRLRVCAPKTIVDSALAERIGTR